MKNLFIILIFSLLAGPVLCQKIIIEKKVQAMNVVKVAPLTPLSGKLVIGYERFFSKGFSLDLSAGYIGIGVNTNEIFRRFRVGNQRDQGYLVALGFKIQLSPQKFYWNSKKTQLIRGAYFEPELRFSHWWYGSELEQTRLDPATNEVYTVIFPIKGNVYAPGLMFNFGYQFSFVDALTLDIGGAMGYGFVFESNGFTGEAPPNIELNTRDTRRFFKYSYASFSNRFPMAFAINFTLGYAF